MKHTLAVASAVLCAAWGSTSIAATLNVDDSGGQPYMDIQSAINAATSGDMVYVFNGNYTGALDIVDKPLTLQGESEAGVMIDASASADYSIDARMSGGTPGHFEFHNFTLIGNATGSASYGLKIAGDNVDADVSNVTVTGCKRTAVDLNGLASGSLDQVTATGTISGNGIALTDCDNITLSNITTSGNAWGGLAIYTLGTFFTGGSDGVTLVSGGNSFGETPQVYTEVGGGYPIDNLSISTADYPFQVGGISSVNHTFFAPDETYALTVIAGSGLQAQAWLLDRVSGDYIVDPGAGMFFGPALAIAGNGTTINAYAGTVEEQLHITSDVTIQGAGRNDTTILSPVSMAESFNSGSGNNFPVVFVDGTDSATIRDLTVDGGGRGNTNVRFQGVAFWNAGGAVIDCDVVHIRNNPFDGSQHGIGIYAFNDTGGPYSIEVGGCNVNNFQKNGMALSGTNLDVDIHDCDVTGYGDTNTIAQNGIQVSYGASGTVTNCTVADMRWLGATWVSSGLLLYQVGNVDLANVSVSGVQAPVYLQDGSGSFTDCDVSGGDYDAVTIYNSSATLASSGVRAAASPAEEAPGSESRPGPMATSYAVSVSGGCLDGDSIPTSYGIGVYSSGGPVTVDISNIRVANYDYGIVAADAAVTVNVNDSAITGNTTAGYYNAGGAAQDITDNWWGDVSGPSGDGAGFGDAVLGGNADFTPFLATGSSSTSCAFTPSGGTNTVAPVQVGTGCISVANVCQTFDIDISRVEATNMRGFSVDFEIDDLALCNGDKDLDILQGSYLSSIGGTVFQVLDNGGGSYTVDCAILGTPCGQTVANGTLFTVNVTTPGYDTTGSITVTDVTFRDCSNAPIAGSPGAPAFIDVDGTPPSPVADLATAKKLTGNDSDGTTAVLVTFSLTETPAVTEVYRAPMVDSMGDNAYPEYDDVGGVAPTPPASYAAIAAPWELASAVNTGDYDETTERGYWYYVVFTQDDCGNWSAPSNMTSGVLNYHLGDVTNGSVNGQGDNLVGTNDVSLLGIHYGALVPTGDTFNYLDVGPTSDFSVNGLPQTDDVIQFEDLIIFAINFGQVSLTEPQDNSIALAPKGGAVPSLVLHPAAVRADGILQANLVLSQSDVVQGVHARIDYDPAEMELVSVQPGDLVTGQGAFFGTIESDGSVAIDGAALGTGNTFHGSGLYATVTFRQTNRGATPALAEVMLRDTANRNLLAPEVDTRTGSDAAHNGAANEQPSLDARTEPLATTLLGATPNPFRGSTAIRFQLAEQTDVRVDVYSISGRLVRSLYSGSMAAGSQEVTWDGRTSVGARAESGVYLYRLQTGSKIWTAKLVLDRR
ncbi:MAG: T9SS type A sorting domain-containing protein [Candidatus Eisenbacteria bacterium]|uniref:T9SS type A sorting domain-containing protein n=1 Tax=Eiseniibacteriota bacterium TaxID=2212470 RepID=A0A956SHK2_UNCEI|nr:T9SS type A sorting domain-containing protein [Candidatus Eisenbacteria bacterium]